MKLTYPAIITSWNQHADCQYYLIRGGHASYVLVSVSTSLVKFCICYPAVPVCYNPIRHAPIDISLHTHWRLPSSADHKRKFLTRLTKWRNSNYSTASPQTLPIEHDPQLNFIQVSFGPLPRRRSNQPAIAINCNYVDFEQKVAKRSDIDRATAHPAGYPATPAGCRRRWRGGKRYAALSPVRSCSPPPARSTHMPHSRFAATR